MCSLKKTTVLASSLALSLLVAALVGCDAQNAAGTDTKDKDADAKIAQYVERGRKLANTSECLACHTPIRPLTADGTPTGTPVLGPDGKPVVAPDFEHAFLAGGNAWLTPGLAIGVSPNLTPYPGSDMATLSADELAAKWKTIKDGQLSPPMPGLEKYDIEDLKALAYYFKSVPAISSQPPAKYAFKGKLANDKSWPVPGWMKAKDHPQLGAFYVGDDHTGGVIPGNLEISIAPGINFAYGQDLINANIAEANK